jgi:hypothetical protein
MVEQRLESLGYGKIRRNMWLQKKQVVHIVHSSEFGRSYICVMWREEWENDYAIIYDYSSGGGPTCIVPVRDLFMSDFVKEKRQKISYVNSGYWWSQKFPLDHELGRLVLSFKERWDLLY